MPHSSSPELLDFLDVARFDDLPTVGASNLIAEATEENDSFRRQIDLRVCHCDLPSAAKEPRGHKAECRGPKAVPQGADFIVDKLPLGAPGSMSSRILDAQEITDSGGWAAAGWLNTAARQASVSSRWRGC